MATRRRYDLQFKEHVLEYAEQTSGEETAKHFNIDTKRIRYWRRQKEELLLVSEELEEKLWDWIHSMRRDHTAVTRTTITRRALEIYPSVSEGGKAFVASPGWLQRFLQRNELSLRRRSAAPPVDPEVLTGKLVGFIDRVGRTVSAKKISESDIIAMDETAVCLGSVKGRSRLTAVLAAAADGTKLKPFIVFRGTDGEEETTAAAAVRSSVNGWMSDALTADWLRAVVGQSTGAPRLLVWDSYRCHVGASAKDELSGGYGVTTAAIPRGCTRFVQAADVMWKEPFRRDVEDAYRHWTDQENQENRGPPPRRLLVDWVVSAWDKLDPDLIRKSFKVCGLSVKRDGSEDHLVLCFRDGQPCSAGRDQLTQVRHQNQNQENQEEEDEEELFNNELVVLDDEEEVQQKVTPVMSAIVPPTHLQCPLCGHFSKSHAHQLTHLAAAHPTRLDGATVGRLGNILMYQSTAKLIHCVECFYTSRDFTKIYKHLISRHCEDHRGEEEEHQGKEEKKKTKEEEEEEERKREEHQGEEEKKKTKDEEEDSEKDAVKRKGSSEEEQKKTKEEEEKKRSSEEEEQKKTKEEEEKRKRSSEEERPDEDVSPQKEEGDESVLMFDGAGYHCLICGWKTKLKALGVNHVVRKHDIPKAYASQAIRRDANANAPRPAEEEEVGGAGLSGEQLKEEMEATAKVVRFISNRFVCLLCGWKTKLKGFAISHVVRFHDVERPYGCLRCSRSFFLPSRLQQHVRAAHRPGRYACPFCCFRSSFIGGFRRHCSRCNAREEGEEQGRGGGGGGGGEEEEEEEQEEEEEERKERRGGRKRRRTERVMEEEEEDDD